MMVAACQHGQPQLRSTRPPALWKRQQKLRWQVSWGLFGNKGTADTDSLGTLDVAAKEVAGLSIQVQKLQERIAQLEGRLERMSEQQRDRAVSMLEALQDPTTDKLIQLQQGAAAAQPEAKEESKPSLDSMLTNFTEIMSQGYMEAVHKLRDRLIMCEWELQRKSWAMRQGVAAFEAYVAENKLPGMTFESMTALYEDPTKLDVIEDLHLRLRARAFINQSMMEQQVAVYQDCTEQAQKLAAQFSQGELISKVLPEGGIMEALKAVAVNAVLPGK